MRNPCVFLSLLGLLVAAPAGAVPTTYFFDTGTATITADTSGGTPVVAATALPLDGVSVTFDASAITLDDFEFTIPTSGLISMLTTYGGFDQFVIESADLQPGIPYSTISGTPVGPGQFTFLAGFIDINGFYSASLSTGPPPPPVNNVPVPFLDNSFISGSINTNTMQLELTGITLAVIPGGVFGETEDLIAKADIVFNGTVPEPATGLLVGLGIGALGARRGRIRHRNSA